MYNENDMMVLETNNGVLGVSTLNDQVIWKNIDSTGNLKDITYTDENIYLLYENANGLVLKQIAPATGRIVAIKHYGNKNLASIENTKYGINIYDFSKIYAVNKNGIYVCKRIIPSNQNQQTNRGYYRQGKWISTGSSSSTASQTLSNEDCNQLVQTSAIYQNYQNKYLKPVVWKSENNNIYKVFVYTSGKLYIISQGNNLLKQETVGNIYAIYTYKDNIFMSTETGVIIYDPELMRIYRNINTIGSPVYITNIDNIIYLGTKNGYVVSLNPKTDFINYNVKAIDGIVTGIIKGKIGGKSQIIIGGGNEITAMNVNNGKISWKYTSPNQLNSILGLGIGKNEELYYSIGKYVNSMDVKTTCSILSHQNYQTLDYKHLLLSGRISPVSSVSLYINGKSIGLTVNEDGTWTYTLDPSTLKVGNNIIACGDADNGGMEINLIYPKDFKFGYIYAQLPNKLTLGSAINLEPIDVYTGEKLNNFYVIMDGHTKRMEGSSKVIRFTDVGIHTLEIKKEGYLPYKIQIKVEKSSGLVGIIIDIIGIIVFAIILYLGYITFIGVKKQNS